MMEQGRFVKLLAELLELAAVKDNRIVKAEVDQWFEELSLNREQLALVYRYLEENQVRISGLEKADRLTEMSCRKESYGLHETVGQEAVDGRGDITGQEERIAWKKSSGTGSKGMGKSRTAVRAGGRKISRQKDGEENRRVPEEENRYYRMYLSDLKAVSPCTIEEMERLMPRVLAGELAAADRLAEGNLHRVAEWARPFMGRGVVISDLIQEGNMVLMEEIHLLKSQYPCFDAEDFLYILKKKSETAMEEAIRQQESHKGIGEKVARRANRIMDLTEEIAREQGAQATVAQLAELLHITEEEVRDIMKISLDVINLAKVAGDPAAFESRE